MCYSRQCANFAPHRTLYKPNNTQQMKNIKVIYGIIAALVIALLATGIWIFQQNREMADFKEQVEIEKQRDELEKEYAELADQYALYEGQKTLLKNDSLIAQLEAEQIKVQRLYDELKSVKNTSAARINELKKELETLRGIMRTYVAQIDSLNVANKKLRKENETVKRKYKEVTQKADELTREREELTEMVTRASKLDAVNIQVKSLNKRGKKAKKIKDTTQLEITFSIAKNVTAEVGEKYIYARITKPDGDVLTKSSSDLFAFEGSEIAYSCRKLIEYTGEELNDITLYWNVEEFLYPGDYEVTIFADNFVIGKRQFSLSK